jgi:hypothetical protein
MPTCDPAHQCTLNRSKTTTNSVIEHRLQVLLASRQNRVLLLVLQVGELLDRFFDDLEGGLDLVFGDDERRREADDVLVGWFGLRREKRSVSVRSIEGVRYRRSRSSLRTRATRFSGSRRICG